MGIPTIFVKHSGMPEKDASLMKLFHVVDTTSAGRRSPKLGKFNFLHPPRNPGADELRDFRHKLLARICSKPYLADYARMYADTEMTSAMDAVTGCHTK